MLLYTSEIWATYRAAKRIEMPFHTGSLLRGVLGRALRRVSCLEPGGCEDACRNTPSCSYSRLFDPPVPDPLPHPVLKGATALPQPLVPLFPSPGKVTLQPGDDVRLGLRVLGRHDGNEWLRIQEALESLPMFPLGTERGALELSEVKVVGPRERPVTVGVGEAGRGHLWLRTETPLWWERDKQLVTKPTFTDLVVAAHRRVVSLAAIYGAVEESDEEHFRGLRELSREVERTESTLRPLQWDRLATTRKERHPLRGVVGRVAFSGPIGAFVPLLRAAEAVHLGKGTSFGLGRFALTVQADRQSPLRDRQS